MAVFVAYSDESGVGNTSGEFMVTGYVAKEEEWPYVSRAWQERVLDGKPKIPYLHMTEMRDEEWRKTKGNGISYEESERRIDEAVKLLSHSGALSIVTSTIQRSELTKVIHERFGGKKKVPENLREPDYFCFLAYSMIVLKRAHAVYQDAEQVDFVVSRKQRITHYIQEAHDKLREIMEPELLPLMGDIVPASMENRLPLQAIDLLCWHQQRLAAKRMTDQDRRRFRLLIETPASTGYDWKPDTLKKVADRFAEIAELKSKSDTN